MDKKWLGSRLMTWNLNANSKESEVTRCQDNQTDGCKLTFEVVV